MQFQTNDMIEDECNAPFHNCIRLEKVQREGKIVFEVHNPKCVTVFVHNNESISVTP